ncbi:tyrosine-type recombinase/integrase [Paraburkholderia sp. EG304]|uniref:tyrosine-type recombinase/integrase n=1 Tax=Paraburkholderia sp. EG304 TaxID=3237015 RepID=UPI00397B8C92
MAKVNFTAARVASFEATPGKTQTIYWDAKTPGLGLRVTPAGARAYVFESRLFGKTVRITIGDAKAWLLDKARTEAARLKTAIDDGKDPREQAAERRAAHEARKLEARRKDATVSEAWTAYLDAQRSKWSERHMLDHQHLAQAGGEKKRRGDGLTVAGPLAPLMLLKLSSLSAETVAAWLESESQNRPTNAEQAYRKLRAFIRWCAERADYRDLVPEGAYTARSVRDAVPRPKAKDDCLQREQLPAWFAAVRKIGNPVISAYLQGLLLTGARREELAGLRWTDVDFQWRSLSIADKVEGSRVIPLTQYLASLLAALPRRNEWVFSSPAATDGKIAEPRIAHTKALASAGLPHVSLHGLRRSFGTLCEWVEMPSGISAQLMGHKPSALAEKHYRRRPLDLLRMWHDKIEVWMLDQAGIQFDAEEAKPGLRAVNT